MKKLKNILSLNQLKNQIVDDIEIDNIQYNSSKCTKGSAFFALKGTVTDGHKYIKNAIENGAVCIICEDDIQKSDFENIIFIKVENSRKALAEASDAFYDFPSSSMKIIGVTGTNGKTTTTFILSQMLEKMGRKTGIIGTTGIFVGDVKFDASHTTPESLELAQYFAQMRDMQVEYVIMEVSSHALHQGRTSALNFDAAIFTNLTHDHLDYHKTMKEYAQAKKILFDQLNENSTAIAFSTSEFTDYILSGCSAKNIYKIGYLETDDFVISDSILTLNHSEYNLKMPNQEVSSLKTKLSGKFNIENTAVSAALLFALGFPISEIQKALLYANGAPGRMDKIVLENGAIALVDYAHTPDALEKALSAAKNILSDDKSAGRLISVFGCGGDRDNSKRPVMGKHSLEIADYTIITDDNPRTENPVRIIQDILAGINDYEASLYEVIHSRAEAIQKAYSLSKEGDIILIAGKGHENYQIIGTTKYHFDDKEILSEFVKK